MKQLIRMAIVTIVTWLLAFFFDGRLIHPKEVYMHPSKNATYIDDMYCNVSADLDIDDKQFDALLDWCRQVRKDLHK